MNYFLIQATVIAGVANAESTFWVQILVFLLLVVLWGVYSLVKSRQNESNIQRQNLAEETSIHHAKRRWRFQLPQERILDFDSPDTAGHKKPKNELTEKKSKDLHSGMELLESDFLLSIVENTEDNDQKDVTMRRLNFNELLRRKKLNQVNSTALKVYAINRGNLYGKDIQCEAMRQLAERTAHKTKHNSLQPAVPPSL